MGSTHRPLGNHSLVRLNTYRHQPWHACQRGLRISTFCVEVCLLVHNLRSSLGAENISRSQPSLELTVNRPRSVSQVIKFCCCLLDALQLLFHRFACLISHLSSIFDQELWPEFRLLSSSPCFHSAHPERFNQDNALTISFSTDKLRLKQLKL